MNKISFDPEQLRARLEAARTLHHEHRRAFGDANALLQRLSGGAVPVLDGSEDGEPIEATKRTRKRKPNLATVAKQAAKSKIPVAAYEFRPDGTIVAVVGKPNAVADEADDVTPEDRDQWH